MPASINRRIILRIVAIEKDEKNSSMSSIYLEDKTNFCLPNKRIDALDLVVGKELEPETIEYILNTEVYMAAKGAAVKYLALKLRTSYEISQKLNELGYDDKTIEKVIENLTEIDYLDDYKYAVKFISEKSKLKPKSVKMLSMELKYKGVRDDIIDRAFEEIDLNEDDVAYELLRKKYLRYTSFEEKDINKMRTFLLNRGFSFKQISNAISKFIPDE